MQSAEELSIEWEKTLGEAFCDTSLDKMQEMIATLIRARDREIVEACKAALRVTMDYDPEETEADELLALDSVLRDRG